MAKSSQPSSNKNDYPPRRTGKSYPSSSKHDARVGGRNKGNNGGDGNNAGGPYLAPDMSTVER